MPLYALIQLRSAPEQRARIIAANNILNALFMVVGALAAAGLLGAGLSIPALFGVAAICNAAVALYIYGLVPEFLLRFIAWLLIHSFYKLKKRGVEHIPHEGAAVVICNHVSFVDPGDPDGDLAAADPLRHGPPYFQNADHLLHLPPHPRHPDRAGEGRSGDDGGGLRGSGEGAGTRANWSASSRKGGSPIPASCIPSVPALRASSNATRCR